MEITLTCPADHVKKGGNKATCQDGQLVPTTTPLQCLSIGIGIIISFHHHAHIISFHILFFHILFFTQLYLKFLPLQGLQGLQSSMSYYNCNVRLNTYRIRKIHVQERTISDKRS